MKSILYITAKTTFIVSIATFIFLNITLYGGGVMSDLRGEMKLYAGLGAIILPLLGFLISLFSLRHTKEIPPSDIYKEKKNIAFLVLNILMLIINFLLFIWGLLLNAIQGMM